MIYLLYENLFGLFDTMDLSVHGLSVLLLLINLLVSLAASGSDMSVVALTVLVNLFLLFPAVVENLEDKKGAWDNKKENDDDSDNEEHVEEAGAVINVVPVGAGVTIDDNRCASVDFPVGSEGVDDEDCVTHGACNHEAKIDIVQKLANISVVGLDNDQDENGSHDEGKGEAEPHASNGIANRLEKVEDSNQDGGLGEGHAAAAAPPWFVTCINAHSCCREF